MADTKDKISADSRMVRDRQGGTIVPGSPRSGCYTKPSEGQNKKEEKIVWGGVADGPAPGLATVEDPDVEDPTSYDFRPELEVRWASVERSPSPETPVAGFHTPGTIPEDRGKLAASEDDPGLRKRKKNTSSHSIFSNSSGSPVVAVRKRSRPAASTPSTKGRARNPLIGDSSGESDVAPGVTLSDGVGRGSIPLSLKKKKKNRTRSCRSTLDGSQDEDPETREIPTIPCESVDFGDLNALPAEEVRDIALVLLKDLEKYRSKSKKIQGRIQKAMMLRIDKLRLTTWSLFKRVAEAGDTQFFSEKADRLTDELRKARTERDKARNRERSLRQELEALRAEKLDSGRGELGMGRGPVQEDEDLPPPPPPSPSGLGGRPVMPLTIQDVEKCVENRIAAAMFAVFGRGSQESISSGVSTPVPMEDDRVDFPPLPQRPGALGSLGSRGAGQRRLPRVVSNVQVAPPSKRTSSGPRRRPAPLPSLLVGSGGGATRPSPLVPDPTASGISEGSPRAAWERRKRKGAKKKEEEEGHHVKGSSRTGVTQPTPAVPRRRPPKAAAVLIKAAAGDASYAEILKRARDEVSLRELDIAETRLRRAANGGILIEVPGVDGARKAEALAVRLSTVFEGQARISRPTAKGEAKLVGVDESMTPQEIRGALAGIAGCPEGDVDVAPLLTTGGGRAIVWVRSSLAVVNKLAGLGRVQLGWSSARVELARPRPVQCFKCWHFGHVRAQCTASVDRTGRCFRCGCEGHSSRSCRSVPKCMACADRNLASEHCLGFEICQALAMAGPKRRAP